jgi:hypothetical protein
MFFPDDAVRVAAPAGQLMTHTTLTGDIDGGQQLVEACPHPWPRKEYRTSRLKTKVILLVNARDGTDYRFR